MCVSVDLGLPVVSGEAIAAATLKKHERKAEAYMQYMGPEMKTNYPVHGARAREP